jgi:hypothetical protein
MKNDHLKLYVTARQKLLKEKATLESRLAQLNRALALEPAPEAPASKAPARAAGRGKSPAKRVKNAMSLKAAVIKVTTGKPLTKKEILAALQKLGYRFNSDMPLNSLNTVLYTGKVFKNQDGKYGPA